MSVQPSLPFSLRHYTSSLLLLWLVTIATVAAAADRSRVTSSGGRRDVTGSLTSPNLRARVYVTNRSRIGEVVTSDTKMNWQTGVQVLLYCSLRGIPERLQRGLRFTWIKDGVTLNNGTIVSEREHSEGRGVIYKHDTKEYMVNYYLTESSSLLVTGVDREDSGVYQCQIYVPRYKRTVSSGRITALVKNWRAIESMYFTVIPHKTQVPPGGVMTLRCATSANLPPTDLDINWTKDGFDIGGSGYRSGRLSISTTRNNMGRYVSELRVWNFAEEHRGSYKCYIPAIEGVTYGLRSKSAHVTMETRSKRSQGLQVPRSAPQNVRFKFRSSTNIRLQWDKPAPYISQIIYYQRRHPDDKIVVTLSAVSTLYHMNNLNVTDTQGYTFQVRLLNEAGYGPWSSPLTFYPSRQVHCPFPGYIENGKILLVRSVGKYTYKFFVKKVEHGAVIEFVCDGGFTLDGVEEATCLDGKWDFPSLPTCVHNNTSSSPTIRRRKRDVNQGMLPSQPRFVIAPTDQFVEVGHTVRLECLATGNPQPTVFWKREGSTDPLIFPNQIKDRYSMTDNGTLIIKSVQTSDCGLYVCEALSQMGSATIIARLEVQDMSRSLPRFVIAPRDQIVQVGHTTRLECVATGNPQPTVFWKREHSPVLWFPNREDDRYSVTYNGTLIIESVQNSDRGVYVCQAMNQYASATVSARIEVEEKTNQPVLDTTTVNITVNSGQTVVLPCSVPDLGGRTVLWSVKRNNRTRLLTIGTSRIVTDSRYSIVYRQRPLPVDYNLYIHDVSTEDEGEYNCTVSTNPPRSKVVRLYILKECQIGRSIPNGVSSYLNEEQGVIRQLRGSTAPSRPISVPDSQQIRFRCNDGFQLVGPLRVECKNGSWASEFPQCTQLSSTVKPTDDISDLQPTKMTFKDSKVFEINGEHKVKSIKVEYGVEISLEKKK